MAANIITVTSSAQLLTALKAATGGETILLAGEAKFSLSVADLEFPSAVTIASANPDKPATFETVALTGCSNIVIDSVKFDSAGTTRAEWLNDFNVTACSDIALINSVMTGTATAYNDGKAAVADNAISILDSTGIIIAGNTIQNYYTGLYSHRSSNVIIEGNELTKMQGDGMQFSAMTNLLIKDNYIHDFLGSLHSLNHDDMIQFWTAASTTPSKNITITGNILDSGDGASTQGIFFGNEIARADPTRTNMYYQNVVIENNLVRNGEFNGITVDHVNGLSIKNNAVLFDSTTINKESTANAIFIQVLGKATNAVVSNNVSDSFSLVAGVTQSNNTKPTRGTDGSSVLLPAYYPKETAPVVDLSKGGTGTGSTGGDSSTSGDGGTTPQKPVTPPAETKPDPVVVPPAEAEPVEELPASKAIEGTGKADSLSGTNADDIMRGYAGNDTIYGLGGNDTIDAGDGNDIVYGGDGDDIIQGKAGNDTLYGDAGDDTLYGGDGDDQLFGGTGNDILHGEGGNDRILGGAGNDFVYGGDGNDAIYGEAGNDVLYGGTGNDLIYGGIGNDFLFGDAGDDLLYGEDGNDVIYGGAGGDGIRAGNGNDFVFGGTGNEIIFGDAGNDVLFGEAGNDTINGGDGDDIILGGAGNDTLSGGAGKDLFVFNTPLDSTRDTITDFNVKEDKIVLDTSIFTALAGKTLTSSMFRSGSGPQDKDDYLFYQNGVLYYDADGNGKGAAVAIATISNKAALTVANIQLITPAALAALTKAPATPELSAASQASTAKATSGSTESATGSTSGSSGATSGSSSAATSTPTTTKPLDLVGTAGADTLRGSDGNDVLQGKGGNDWLYGGKGADTLTGGLGNDVFVFDTKLDGSVDTIKDFSSVDKIGLDTDIFTALAGKVTADNFRSGSMAKDANDHLLYVDGVLYYDPDGNGAQEAQAIVTLSNKFALSHTSFLLL